MKTIEFKVYEPTAGTLEEVGTLSSLVGKGGKLEFIPKNFRDATKRVAVVVTKKDGTSATIACSAPVSSAVRKQYADGTKVNPILAGLAKLLVLQNEDGKNFISMPAGTGNLVGGTIEELNKTADVVEFSPEELVAL